VAPAAATTGAPIDAQFSSAQKAAPEDVESQAPTKAHDDTVNQVDHHSAGRTIGENEADEHSVYASRLGLSVADAMNPATVAAAFQSHISALEWESPDQLRKGHEELLIAKKYWEKQQRRAPGHSALGSLASSSPEGGRLKGSLAAKRGDEALEADRLQDAIAEYQLALDNATPGEKLRLGRMLDKAKKALLEEQLRKACWEGDVESIRAVNLTRDLANMTFDAKSGVSLLYIAAQEGHAAVVSHLLTCGADSNRATSNNATPLFAACKRGHSRVAQLLIKSGANISTKVSSPGNPIDGWTSLHMAVSMGHVASVQALIEGGCDIHTALEDGTTVIHMATTRGWADIIRLLAKAGAAVDQTKNAGNATSLLMAAQKGYGDVVKALVDSGADLTRILATQTGSAVTLVRYAHDIARQRGYHDVASVLRVAPMRPLYGAKQRLAWMLAGHARAGSASALRISTTAMNVLAAFVGRRIWHCSCDVAIRSGQQQATELDAVRGSVSAASNEDSMAALQASLRSGVPFTTWCVVSLQNARSHVSPLSLYIDCKPLSKIRPATGSQSCVNFHQGCGKRACMDAANRQRSECRELGVEWHRW
jgi:ankyrin repeat protein